MGGSTSDGGFAFLGISWCKPDGCCRPLAGPRHEFVERVNDGLVGVWVEGGPCYLEERQSQLDDEGDLYEGQWMGKTKHGHGRLIRKDIGVYVGQFAHGQVKGQGLLTMDSGDCYDGQWQNGTMHGLGKYTYQNGSSHEGQFVQGCKNGFGQEILADKSSFEGQFVDGKRHGRGKYSSADGSTFDGQFNDDKMDGKGRYRFVGGKAYDGQWQKSRMHGMGRMDWPDGRKFEGNFEADRKSGPGKFTWVDGSCYEGQWYLGKQHGHGVHTNAWGQQASGKWIAGRPLNVPGAPSDPASSSASTSGVRRMGSAPIRAIGSLFRSSTKLQTEKNERLQIERHASRSSAASNGHAGVGPPAQRQDTGHSFHSQDGLLASDETLGAPAVAGRPSLASIASRSEGHPDEDAGEALDGLEIPGGGRSRNTV